MNNANGNNSKPLNRNANHSAQGVSVRKGNVPARKPVDRNQMQRPAQKPVQRPVQKQVQKPGQRPVHKQPVNAAPKAAPVKQQRPVQKRPVQKTPVKKVPNQPAQNIRKPVQKQPAKRAFKPVPQKTVKVDQTKLFKGLVIAVAVILVVLLGVGGYSFFKDETGLINREVTIEAGTQRPDLNMFLSGEPTFPQLVSTNLNFDEVNINLPQTISFNIKMYGRNFACKLIIQDSIPPVGQGIPQKLFAAQELPDAASCITGIEDITDVAATWKDIPDYSAGGNFIAVAMLTDGCGNETPVNVPLEVTRDDNAPDIVGALDIEAYIGDSISYRDGVIVTDDYDENPVLTIDTTNVNINEPGTYEVIYTAKDISGNEKAVSINLTISEKPEGYIEPEVVYDVARDILDELTEPGMTEEEVALQIIWWCRYNIRFILRTYSNSWTEAAYNAYVYGTGNCYSTVYAVKVLLDVAGIENMIIERYPYQTATHFWNYVKINGQWYHCDATWREGYDSYFFMYTTDELLNFWQGGWNGFQFAQEKYPESATESVQYRIDYKNHTMKEP